MPKVARFSITRTLCSFNANECISGRMIIAGVIDAVGVLEAVGVEDGKGVTLGANVGEGVLNSLVAICGLAHDDKSNKDR